MTQINLLPWREQKREQEKKFFLSMLAVCVFFASFIVFLMNVYVSDLVSNQISRNRMLEKEIALYDQQIREIKTLEAVRNMLIARMSIVRNLQSTRTLMVHLFDEIIRIMPSGVYLMQLEGKNNIITVSGYSESNTYVSQLMNNIEQSEWIHNPTLSQIKRMEGKQQAADNEFKLTFILDSKSIPLPAMPASVLQQKHARVIKGARQ